MLHQNIIVSLKEFKDKRDKKGDSESDTSDQDSDEDAWWIVVKHKSPQ